MLTDRMVLFEQVLLSRCGWWVEARSWAAEERRPSTIHPVLPSTKSSKTQQRHVFHEDPTTLSSPTFNKEFEDPTTPCVPRRSNNTIQSYLQQRVRRPNNTLCSTKLQQHYPVLPSTKSSKTRQHLVFHDGPNITIQSYLQRGVRLRRGVTWQYDVISHVTVWSRRAWCCRWWTMRTTADVSEQ